MASKRWDIETVSIDDLSLAFAGPADDRLTQQHYQKLGDSRFGILAGIVILPFILIAIRSGNSKSAKVTSAALAASTLAATHESESFPCPVGQGKIENPAVDGLPRSMLGYLTAVPR